MQIRGIALDAITASGISPNGIDGTAPHVNNSLLVTKYKRYARTPPERAHQLASYLFVTTIPFVYPMSHCFYLFHQDSQIHGY